MSKLLAALMVLAACLSFAGMAFADGVTGQVQVTASVNSTCQFVGKTDITFSTYDPIAQTAQNGAGSVSIMCVNGTAYHVALDQGSTLKSTSNSSCSAPDRAMKNAANASSFLCYLVKKAADSTDWGAGSATSPDQWGSRLDATGTGTSQVHGLSATIRAGQTGATSGTYQDTIGVTVTF